MRRARGKEMDYDITKMSAQEVFNASVRHVINQGEPSATDGGVCLYRGPRDLKCAAGIFLTEEQAAIADASAGDWAEVVFGGISAADHQDLIVELQLCHDKSASFPEAFLHYFKNHARNVAVNHSLDASALD